MDELSMPYCPTCGPEYYDEEEIEDFQTYDDPLDETIGCEFESAARQAVCSDCHWKTYMNGVHHARNTHNAREQVALDDRDTGEICKACSSIRQSCMLRSMFNFSMPSPGDTSDGGVGGTSSPGGAKYTFPAFAAKKKVKQRAKLTHPLRKTVSSDKHEPATPPRKGMAPKEVAKAPGGGGDNRKVGVRPRLVPMTPEQDESIREQHLWPTVPPEKRVMKLVGQLLWVARCTRTDVSYPVSKLASGVSRWRSEQVHVMSQVVGYLKRTAKMVLRFKPVDPSRESFIELHTDASWHTPRSQSGCALVVVQYEKEDEERQNPIVCGLLDWNSSKQSLTADSSAASELISAHLGVRNCLPMAISLREIWSMTSRNVAIRIDNKAVLDIAKSGASKGLAWLATKPFSIRAGCLHDLTCLGVLTPEFIGTEGQLSDLNTKALAKIKLAAILEKLNLVDLGMDDDRKALRQEKKTFREMGPLSGYSFEKLRGYPCGVWSGARWVANYLSGHFFGRRK